MADNSDDVPTQIVRRPVVARPRPAQDVPHRTSDDTPTARVVVPDREQVVTRRISKPHRPPAAPPAAEVAEPPSHAAASASAQAAVDLPVGWVTVIAGPGRGRFLPLHAGMNALGRDASNRLAIDFGDEAISRTDHAFLVYDDEQRKYWVQHGGKSNLVRLNGNPVLAPTPLGSGDIIRVGNTELRFTAFCDDAFDWASRP